MTLASLTPILLTSVVLLLLAAGLAVMVTRRSTKPDDVSSTRPTPPLIESHGSREVLLPTGEQLDLAPLDGATASPGQIPSDSPTSPQQVADIEVVETVPTVETSMAKSRGLFASFRAARRLRGIDRETWEDLEATLLRADVGVKTTKVLLETLQEQVASGSLSNNEDLFHHLRVALLAQFNELHEARQGELAFTADPEAVSVWLVVGVNGVGKTTTIGKLANRATLQGHKVLMAAGDTFRAAAGEQLETWGERADTDVVRGAAGGDPSAIVYDAIQRAKARKYDVVLADTAGRLHNKVNLVEELKKIRRVADKAPGAVTEVLLVIDATTGQNALQQARAFTEAVEVTGVVLTKLDGSAKGGVVVAIEAELGIPVRFIGVGEGLGDLLVFEPESFVDALLGNEPVG